MIALLALLLAHAPAAACSSLPSSSDLGLPGEGAGLGAVFTGTGDAHLFTEAGEEVATTRSTYTVAEEAGDGALLVPDAPLVPGTYVVRPCGWGRPCGGTVTEDGGDPGVPPEPPELTIEPHRVGQGEDADCGPSPPGNIVTVTTGGGPVVFASAPVETLAGAALLAILEADPEPGAAWWTTHAGDVYAARIDAEGELSAWTGPHTLTPGGCATGGTAPLGATALLALFAIVTRRRS